MKNFKPILNVLPSPPDARDWNVQAHIAKKYTFPNVLDFRPLMMPIRSQGNQGSCAAMAGAAMKEYQEHVDCGIVDYFSPQFLYNLRENQDSAGMYMRDLMRILSETGDCIESWHQYGDLSEPSAGALKNAEQYKIGGYARVLSVNDLKQALYEFGPCIICVPVYNYTTRMWKKRDGDELLGGHAMLVVGYNEKGLIIRNSWGTWWGDDGYAYFPEEDFLLNLRFEFWSTVDVGMDSKPKKKLTKIIAGALVSIAVLIIVLCTLLCNCAPVQSVNKHPKYPLEGEVMPQESIDQPVLDIQNSQSEREFKKVMKNR